MPEEAWRPVVGYEGLYEVSDHGRVRSLDRKTLTVCLKRGEFQQFHKGRILRPGLNGRGRLYVSLGKDGVSTSKTVHSLAAEAFLGARPPGMEVRHLDGVPTNNRVDNLKWGTGSENTLDSVGHGTHPSARKTHCKRGHEFTPENTHSYRGKRICITCRRYLDRRLKANKRLSTKVA